jgi:hypothetical protein
VLIEAQVAGTPVIVPAYGGSSSAYVEGMTGAAPTDESRGPWPAFSVKCWKIQPGLPG